MSHQNVSDTELAALVRDLRAIGGDGYTFHRIQEGYPDGVPRAVFAHPHEEPIGTPLGHYPRPLLSLLGRLAADLDALRASAERDTYSRRQVCSVCHERIVPYGGVGPVMMTAPAEDGTLLDGSFCERCNRDDADAGRPERVWRGATLTEARGMNEPSTGLDVAFVGDEDGVRALVGLPPAAEMRPPETAPDPWLDEPLTSEEQAAIDAAEATPGIGEPW